MNRYLVERELIQNNIQVLQKKAGSAVIWAVLKGNGYGLGLLPMAEVCRAAAARFRRAAVSSGVSSKSARNVEQPQSETSRNRASNAFMKPSSRSLPRSGPFSAT